MHVAPLVRVVWNSRIDLNALETLGPDTFKGMGSLVSL